MLFKKPQFFPPQGYENKAFLTDGESEDESGKEKKKEKEKKKKEIGDSGDEIEILSNVNESDQKAVKLAEKEAKKKLKEEEKEVKRKRKEAEKDAKKKLKEEKELKKKLEKQEKQEAKKALKEKEGDIMKAVGKEEQIKGIIDEKKIKTSNSSEGKGEGRSVSPKDGAIEQPISADAAKGVAGATAFGVKLKPTT